jgi:hypothetical protein
MLFTLVKNKDFLGSVDTNPFNFRHYGILDFALYVNITQIPSEGLHIDTGRKKGCYGLPHTSRSLRYSSLERGTPNNTWYVNSRIFHVTFPSNTWSWCVRMSHFTPAEWPSKLRSGILHGITWFGHLPIASGIRQFLSHWRETNWNYRFFVMNSQQIICCLEYKNSFLGVFASDLLPKYPTAESGTLIVITDPHTVSGSHRLAIQFQSRSSKLYYFDSYGLPPHIPSIQKFINRNCTFWDYNSVQLQGPNTAVCGKYCCFFTLYVDRGYTRQNSSGSLAT